MCSRGCSASSSRKQCYSPQVAFFIFQILVWMRSSVWSRLQNTSLEKAHKHVVSSISRLLRLLGPHKAWHSVLFRMPRNGANRGSLCICLVMLSCLEVQVSTERVIKSISRCCPRHCAKIKEEDEPPILKGLAIRWKSQT